MAGLDRPLPKGEGERLLDRVLGEIGLEINCQQGNPPPGTSEGIKLNIPRHIHFNKHVEEGGVTLFLLH